MLASRMNQSVRHDTLIFKLPENLGSANCQSFAARCDDLIAEIRDGQVRNIVVDCHDTDGLGGTALGLLLGVWKSAVHHKAGFVLSGLSPANWDVVHVCRLNRLWRNYGSLEEAIIAVEADTDE
ncbi:MAG: STAS domain-containing protein [Pirellulales bacterium]